MKKLLWIPIIILLLIYGLSFLYVSGLKMFVYSGISIEDIFFSYLYEEYITTGYGFGLGFIFLVVFSIAWSHQSIWKTIAGKTIGVALSLFCLLPILGISSQIANDNKLFKEEILQTENIDIKDYYLSEGSRSYIQELPYHIITKTGETLYYYSHEETLSLGSQEVTYFTNFRGEKVILQFSE